MEPPTDVHADKARPHILRASSGNDTQPRDCRLLLIADLDRPAQMVSWPTFIDLMHGTSVSIFTSFRPLEI